MAASAPAYSKEQCLAYLQRLQLLQDPSSATLPAPTAALLKSIQEAHLTRIAFSCINVHFDPLALPSSRDDAIPFRGGPGISIADPAVIYRKLVDDAAGGFCYENNTGIACLLRGLGYKVAMRAARANFAARGNVKPEPEWSSLVHCVCIVTVPGSTPPETYFVDVGFGGGGPFTPLPLQHGAANTHAQDGVTEFSLERGSLPFHPSPDEDQVEGWTLWKRGPGTKNLRLPVVHVHDTYIHYPQDFLAGNLYVQVDVGSYVARSAVCQRLVEGSGSGQKVLLLTKHEDEQGRETLKGSFYWSWPDGRKDKDKRVETVGDLEDVLEEEFGFRVARKAS